MTTPPLDVRLEHHAPDRLGIGETRPRVSFRLAAGSRRQQGYRIEATRVLPGTEPELQVVERTGDEQVLLPWPFAPLRSREQVKVRVQIRHQDGWSRWSGPVAAEAGLLEPSDWMAVPVGPGWPEDEHGERRPPLVRHSFDLHEGPLHARLYLSAHGLALAELNGSRVGDEELTPGWTSYRHRLRYATFDVTHLLQQGANAIGIRLADGWWRGRLGFGGGRRNIWGSDIAALAQLEIVTADGSKHTVASGADWQVGLGALQSSSLYDGEHVDLRIDDHQFSTPGFDTAGWTPVTVGPLDPSVLVAPQGPPVRCVEELAPRTVQQRGDRRWMIDFGQNHSGRVRLRLPASDVGQLITLRHSEVLEQDGELATTPLRTALATDRIVCAGGPVDWEPTFTIHGYRYAEVDGWAGPAEELHVVSRVIHTDLARRGRFACSDPLLTRLHENAVWGLRSNFVDVPTDCPQRDERLGWTGDIQVFAASAAYLYDVSGFLASWLQDLAAEQQELDWVPLWVPYFDLEPVASMPRGPSAVWGDAALLIPDTLYQRTGDAGLLRRQYASAVAWVEAVSAAAGPDRVCRDSAQLGDWLDPAAPPEDPAAGRTDRYLVATAYFAHAARRLAEMAAVLGEAEDEARYRVLAEEVRTSYAREFLDGGRSTSDAQTAYALTTVFDLWPDEQSRHAGVDRLAELIRQAGWTVGTGFAGTPALLDALTDGGHLDDAYALLTSTVCPSWLYAVTKGSTTIWERWDSLRPDGTINDPSMTSFNHYAFGAVVDWLHRVVAGITPAAPGYRRIRFEPRPGAGLTWAAASHETPYGRASISWKVDDDHLDTTVEVPPGTTAELLLQGTSPVELTAGTHRRQTPRP